MGSPKRLCTSALNPFQVSRIFSWTRWRTTTNRPVCGRLRPR